MPNSNRQARSLKLYNLAANRRAWSVPARQIRGFPLPSTAAPSARSSPERSDAFRRAIRKSAADLYDQARKRPKALETAVSIWARELAHQQLRTLVSNLFAELLTAGGWLPKLIPPSKRKSALGRIFDGTIFSPASEPGKTAGSSSLDRNTEAVEKLTETLERASQEVATDSGAIEFASPAFNRGGRLFQTLLPSAASLAGLLGGKKGITAGAALAGAIFGAKGAGFGIAGLGKVVGGLLGGSITGGLALLGTSFLLPKRKSPFQRAAEIEQILAGNIFEPPEPQAREYGLSRAGAGRLDYGFGEAPRVQVTVNVNAMDARSFRDRAADIADAVRHAMLESHPLNLAVKEMAL